MGRQYKRNFELLIDKDGKRRKVTGLRLRFEIKKSLLGYPNLAKIEVFNVSDETKSFLDSRLTTVTLNVGYDDRLSLIFTGKIRNTFIERQGVDSIVTVYSGDGQKDWEQATLNKTFSDTVSIRQIVTELLDTFSETSVGELKGLDAPADKQRGQTLSGSTKDILNQLGSDYGFNWSIQDGAFYTIPTNSITTASLLVLVNSATGMIGSPTTTEIGADVKTLLNPELQPNAAFKIESVASGTKLGNLNFRNVKRTSAEGTYKVLEVIHKGDTHESEWSSEVQGQSLNV